VPSVILPPARPVRAAKLRPPPSYPATGIFHGRPTPAAAAAAYARIAALRVQRAPRPGPPLTRIDRYV
jgi:hypothetical protein